MEDVIWFVLKFIIAPFIVGLLLYYHRQIWAWLRRVPRFMASVTRKMFFPLATALGIRELARNVDKLRIEVDSMGKEQRRLRKRIAKLEKAVPNPSESSAEAKDEESRGHAL